MPQISLPCPSVRLCQAVAPVDEALRPLFGCAFLRAADELDPERELVLRLLVAEERVAVELRFFAGDF